MSEGKNFGRTLGIGAGVLVIAAAAGAGLVWWQGSIFDAQFDDFAKRLSDEGAKAGLNVSAEITERNFAGRGLMLLVSTGGVEFRWLGNASFGFGTTARLALDPLYGTAVDFPKLGLKGLQDELLVKSSFTGKDVHYSWRVKPFSFTDSGSGWVNCEVGAQTLTGSGHLDKARYDWEGLTCRAEGETLKLGKTALDYRNLAPEYLDADTHFTTEGLDFSGPDLKLGLQKTRISVSTRKEAQTASAAGEPSESASSKLSIAYDVGFDGLKADGRQLFDSWQTKVRFLHVPEMLAAQLAVSSAAGNPFATLSLLEAAFRDDGLTMELDESRLLRGKGEAVLSGRVAQDGERFGAFSFTMDPAVAADVPEVLVELEVLKNSGFLQSVDGRLTSHIEIQSDGTVLANGKPI